jgi:hypothetical protein
MGKSREKYHMVYGIVPYGIGIVPYGIWYRTIRYWASRVERLHVCVKRRLASFSFLQASLEPEKAAT